MATTSSIALMRSRGKPAPSLPTKMASGPENLAWSRDVPLCDAVATRRSPRSFIRPRASDSFVLATGSRNTEPAEARTTLGLKGLTVPSPSTTPPAPKASAERKIVPRLPGSCTPAITSRGPAWDYP